MRKPILHIQITKFKSISLHIMEISTHFDVNSKWIFFDFFHIIFTLCVFVCVCVFLIGFGVIIFLLCFALRIEIFNCICSLWWPSGGVSEWENLSSMLTFATNIRFLRCAVRHSNGLIKPFDQKSSAIWKQKKQIIKIIMIFHEWFFLLHILHHSQYFCTLNWQNRFQSSQWTVI